MYVSFGWHAFVHMRGTWCVVFVSVNFFFHFCLKKSVSFFKFCMYSFFHFSLFFVSRSVFFCNYFFLVLIYVFLSVIFAIIFSFLLLIYVFLSVIFTYRKESGARIL